MNPTPDPKRFRDEMFKLAKARLWRQCLEHIATCGDAAAIYQPCVAETTPAETGNILHCCILWGNDDMEAGRLVCAVLNALALVPQTSKGRSAFVNLKTEAGKTPLALALDRRFAITIGVLRRRGADVPAGYVIGSLDRLIVEEDGRPDVFSSLYDQGLSLHSETGQRADTQWSLEYDFSRLTGVSLPAEESEYDYRETYHAAVVLQLWSSARRQRFLLHPLWQLFIYEKWQRYKWLVVSVLVFQALWLLMSATYVMCLIPVLMTSSDTDDLEFPFTVLSVVGPEQSRVCATLDLLRATDFMFSTGGWFVWVICMMTVAASVHQVWTAVTGWGASSWLHNHTYWFTWSTLINGLYGGHITAAPMVHMGLHLLFWSYCCDVLYHVVLYRHDRGALFPHLCLPCGLDRASRRTLAALVSLARTVVSPVIVMAAFEGSLVTWVLGISSLGGLMCWTGLRVPTDPEYAQATQLDLHLEWLVEVERVVLSGWVQRMLEFGNLWHQVVAHLSVNTPTFAVQMKPANLVAPDVADQVWVQVAKYRHQKIRQYANI